MESDKKQEEQKPDEKKQDASATVRVSLDKMSAYLTVRPATGGGNRIGEAELLKVIAEAGVVHGLLPAEVARAAAEQNVDQLLVASGTPSKNGENGRLEFLISRTRSLKDDEIDDARKVVDLHDLGGLTTVKQGEPLMRRHPPGAGTPGHDVPGGGIAPRPGRDVQFGRGLEGPAAAADDPDLLVAALEGLPVFKRDGISVTDVLSVQDVDLSVGNIDFKGSVTVKGSITSGMRVRASGDIIVGDTIEAAVVDSGANITVRGGITGAGAAAMPGAGGSDMAHVRAAGEIRARFIENAVVGADSILVENEVIQSELTASNQVIVGGERSSKSAIRGGSVRAGNLVRTPVLGAETANETSVGVGVDPKLVDRMGVLKKSLDAGAEELMRLVKVTEMLVKRPDKKEMLERANNTLAAARQKLKEEKEELMTLESAYDEVLNAKIEVTRAIEGVARITIGRQTITVSEPRGPGVFGVDEASGKIRYE